MTSPYILLIFGLQIVSLRPCITSAFHVITDATRPSLSSHKTLEPQVILASTSKALSGEIFISKNSGVIDSPITRKGSSNVQEAFQQSRDPGKTVYRELGSFEKLLTRKRKPPGEALSMPHVCAVEVNGILDVKSLPRALRVIVQSHYLLHSAIKKVIPSSPEPGDGKGSESLAWYPSPLDAMTIVDRALSIEHCKGHLKEAWTSGFHKALDDTDFDLSIGPLWALKVFTNQDEGSHVLLWVFNHAISDQISAHILIDELLSILSSSTRPAPLLSRASSFPPSIEGFLLEGRQPKIRTLVYAMREAALGITQPVILPTYLPKNIQPDRRMAYATIKRRTLCEFRSLSEEKLQGLKETCRSRGLTITAALSAAQLFMTSIFAHEPHETGLRSYKFLLSLNLRAFTSMLEKADPVLCAAGAMDFVCFLEANMGRRILRDGAGKDDLEAFWDVASRCRGSLDSFIERGFIPETAQLFDFGMQMVNLPELVETEAENPSTLGRGYSCGISNAGVYGGKSKYGDLTLRSIFYGVNTAGTGCLFQLSTVSVDGRLCLNFKAPEPIVSRDTVSAFADGFCHILNVIATSR